MRRSNKKRLYIAFYPRNAKATSPGRFHVALLLMSKSPASDNQETMRYHVTNLVTGDSVVEWRFSKEQTVVRWFRLQSLLLLGKIASKVAVDELDHILHQIPLVQDDPSWNCTIWITSAIKLLFERNILRMQTSLTPESILENGVQFSLQKPYDPERPVPTCDVTGKEMTSEITVPISSSTA